MLHGATSYGARACRILELLADEAGFLVLCPDSRRMTWDAIIGRFGPSCGIAFSPGFVIQVTPHGSPRLFFSHGVHDQVLPIDSTSRSIVPALRREGYRVAYREFEGDHEVPPPVAREALTWYLGASNFSPSRVISGCTLT
jgi:phospholipase/carboxylesterase